MFTCECPHSHPPPWQGTQKLVVSSGGALYQPVTMVTSQGQVVTQAIPQGAIQIQNTQVSVRAGVCTSAWGRWRATTITYRLLGALAGNSLVILLRGNVTPALQKSFYHLLGLCCLPVTSKAPVLSIASIHGAILQLSGQSTCTRGPGDRKRTWGRGLRSGINSEIVDESPNL